MDHRSPETNSWNPEKCKVCMYMMMMIKKRVFLIDFDWVGQEYEVRYKHDVNDLIFKAEVVPDLLIASHDDSVQIDDVTISLKA